MLSIADTVRSRSVYQMSIPGPKSDIIPLLSPPLKPAWFLQKYFCFLLLNKKWKQN